MCSRVEDCRKARTHKALFGDSLDRFPCNALRLQNVFNRPSLFFLSSFQAPASALCLRLRLVLARPVAKETRSSGAHDNPFITPMLLFVIMYVILPNLSPIVIFGNYRCQVLRLSVAALSPAQPRPSAWCAFRCAYSLRA